MIYCTACGAMIDEPRCTVCPSCGQTLPLGDGPTLCVQTLLPASVPGSDPYGLVGLVTDQYEIQRFLGKGGMSAVYLVRHRGLDRLSALKVPLPELRSAYENCLDEFFREARMAARLVHPRIVTVHNIGMLAPGGLPFIELEYVAGGSLSRRVQAGQPPEALTVAEWMVQVAEALAEAHGHNVLHRDVKPGNVFLTPHGSAKLGDFGLAWSKSAISNRGGRPVGTPAYMEPEVIRGQEPSPETDVYAFGATFFAVLTGRLPFVREGMAEMLDAHLYAPVPDPRAVNPAVPEPVARVIMRCMAKHRSERYRDGAELLAACRLALGEARGLEQLLMDALASLELTADAIEVEEKRHLCRVTVPLPGGRKQTVYVEATREPVLADRVIRVYSFCAPARPGMYEEALVLNARLPHARVGIEQKEGDLWFVVSSVYPRATCDPEELRFAIAEVAEWADRLEEKLTGADNQ